MLKYFAYGSNLNLEQMKYRCPDAILIGPGILKNWVLKFRGPLDIEQSPGDYVEGALFSISESDLKALDRYEGYPRLYTRFKVRIGRQTAWVYSMNDKRHESPPSQHYFDIVRQGFKDCNLDQTTLLQAATPLRVL